METKKKVLLADGSILFVAFTWGLNFSVIK